MPNEYTIDWTAPITTTTTNTYWCNNVNAVSPEINDLKYKTETLEQEVYMLKNQISVLHNILSELGWNKCMEEGADI